MQEPTWSRRPDGFDESEARKRVAGCRVWACMMDAEGWDGGEAQAGRGGGGVILRGVAGAGMVGAGEI